VRSAAGSAIGGGQDGPTTTSPPRS
jgi:hypothetical protein